MTPAERLRKHQRALEKTQRELDRERTKLENVSSSSRYVGATNTADEKAAREEACRGYQEERQNG